MKDDSKEKRRLLSDEEAKFWDFYLWIGVKGGEDLKMELGLDELNFMRAAPTSNRKPKQYFLYRTIDEIQKAALRIAYWKEYLLEEGPNELHRIDFQSVIDEQQFRARKLSEVLVDAILFSTTNDQNHYADYFLLHELDECVRSQKDRSEFFGFRNRNTQWQIDWHWKEIGDFEKAGLVPKDRWYIKETEKGVMKDNWKTKGVPFSSFRERYMKILPIALPSELSVLGKSYVHAYGGLSKDVHFTPHDNSSNFESEEIRQGVNKVGLLVLALIIRCQHLLGRVPDGANKTYRDMHDSNTGPAELVASLKKKPAEIGDIVWIQGDYAEVLNVTTSKYGYAAYHVKYVEHSPLLDVPEDWFAGFEVRLVAKREQIEKAAAGIAEEIKRELGKDGDRAKLLDHAKKAVIKLSKHIQQLRRQKAAKLPSKS